MSGPSILDRPIRLSELIEPDAYADLCRAFVDLTGVGLRVYDAAGIGVVEVPRGEDLFEWIFGHADAKRALTEFIQLLKRTDIDEDESLTLTDPVAGTNFLVLPIAYQFEVVGKVVLGPYRASGDTDVPKGDGGIDAHTLRRLRLPLTVIASDELRRSAAVLLRATDAVCHAGYRALLTSNMHLESITEAYNDLQTANERLAAQNQELSATNARLRELDDLKSNFLATVSHELRTPLTSVIGYSEMMLEGLAGPLNDEQREYVATIMERGESLLHLISGILDISKIERGGPQALVREPVEAATLVEAALSTVRPQAHKAQLTLDRRVSPELPVLHLDRYKIRQALVNLLGNAVKFTPAGGTVTVVVELAQMRGGTPAARFAVRDTGIGIPTDQLPRIFEAFYQVDNSSTREYGGTGLGLSIVKSFVESHGGQVGVASAPSEGSTFWFMVPLSPDYRRPSGPLPRHPQGANG